MPCYHPLTAYRSLSQGGKVVFSKPAPFAPSFQVPCGQCIGCRLDRSRMWAVRCMHEASLYDRNCFVTLTYNDRSLPAGAALEKSALQRFFKRLRKRFGSGIRYYACGEYGGQFGRPHFHACIFNFDFADKVLWSVRDGVPLYVSADLARLWPDGFSTLGEVTFESAAYVARYVMKKITGEAAEAHYTRLDVHTGELYQVPPEFTVMSRRPGIGKGWFDRFSDEVYAGDFVVMRGAKMRPPRYYDTQLEKIFAAEHGRIKLARRKRAVLFAPENTPERLKVREHCTLSRIQLLKRGLDDET